MPQLPLQAEVVAVVLPGLALTCLRRSYLERVCENHDPDQVDQGKEDQEDQAVGQEDPED